MARRCFSALIAFSLLASVSLAGPNDIVYATKQGKSYHRKNCSLKHGSTGMKLSAAKAKKLAPCKVCKPPTS